MTNALEQIDSYFQGVLSPEDKRRFEQAILDDPEFARQVAFYVSSVNLLKQDARASVLDLVPELSDELLRSKKSRFRELYEQEKNSSDNSNQEDNLRPIGLYGQGKFSKTGIGALVQDDDAETTVRAHVQNRGAILAPVRTFWSKWGMVAAACVATLVVLSVFWFNNSNSHSQMADTFIRTNFDDLGVPMGTVSDSIATAKELYNAGDFNTALSIFEKLLVASPGDVKLLQFAGLSALRGGNYDKALPLFQSLSQINGLISNPGNFYSAITLMKRNKPGDEDSAKRLLEQIVAAKQDHHPEAKEWLDNW